MTRKRAAKPHKADKYAKLRADLAALVGRDAWVEWTNPDDDWHGQDIVAVQGDLISMRCISYRDPVRGWATADGGLHQAEINEIRSVRPLEPHESDVAMLEHSPVRLPSVHEPSACAGDPCTLHNRTDHNMRQFAQFWRDDAGFMERICAHGVGHPDPDERPGMRDRPHGCDGCCRPPVTLESEAAEWGRQRAPVRREDPAAHGQRIEFTCDHGTERVTMSTDAVLLPEVVETFERFLRAAGFAFDGSLDFVGDPGTTES